MKEANHSILEESFMSKEYNLKMKDVQKEINEQKINLKRKRGNDYQKEFLGLNSKYSSVVSESSEDEVSILEDEEFYQFLKEQESSLFSNSVKNPYVPFKKSHFNSSIKSKKTTCNGTKSTNVMKNSKFADSVQSYEVKALTLRTFESLLISSNRGRNPIQKVRISSDFTKKNKFLEEKLKKKID